MKLPSRTAILLGAVAVLVPAMAAAEPGADRLTTGMAMLLESFDEDQREEAVHAFDDDERFDLRLAPLGLEGLRVDEMTDAQWAELQALLAHALSPDGMRKMNTIRSLEAEVLATEGGLMRFFMGRIRKVGRYFLTVFGAPESQTPWGLRFDGHHFSLNLTAIPGAELSATPLFLGGQPRVVPDGMERAGLRVLAGEEELAVDFLNMLSEEERAAAHLAWTEGSAIRRPMSISADVDLVLPPSAGLDREGLAPEVRHAFDALVEVHLENFVPALGERYRKMLNGRAGSVTIQYASAGDSPAAPVEAGRALYYRIQGGGLSIEYDNTSEEADHIHVVFRHPENDFGRDILGEHLARQQP